MSASLSCRFLHTGDLQLPVLDVKQDPGQAMGIIRDDRLHRGGGGVVPSAAPAVAGLLG